MSLLQKTVQQGRPFRSQLSGQQGLRTLRVVHLDKAVVPLFKRDPFRRQLTDQPFATIQTHMHTERQPGLQTQMSQAESGMQPVKVVVQTLARSVPQLEHPTFPVGADFEAVAGFDTAENADQSLGNAVCPRDVQREVFLASLAARQIDHRPSRGFRDGGRRLFDGFGQSHAPVSKVLQQHANDSQETHHALAARQPANGASKANPVQATEHAVDVFLVPFDKLMHGATPWWRELGLTPSLYQQGLRFSLSGRYPVRSGKPLPPSPSHRPHPSWG